MNYLKTLVLSLALASSGAWAECDPPEEPEVPNGKTATYDEMIAGQKAIKEFQEANQEYLSCMEEDIAETEAVAKDEDASDEEKAAAVARHTEAVDTYNAAVSREEELAGEFNSQIQEYQAANAE